MSKGTEFTGKNVEAAIADAEAKLGKPRDSLEIEVVSQGSRGVFGLGGEPARIAVRDPQAVEPAPAPPPAASRPAAPRPTEEREPLSEPTRPEPEIRREPASRREPDVTSSMVPKSSTDTREMAAAARDIVQEILEKMGFEDIEVTVRSDEEPLAVDIGGDNMGMLIGRRGDSLAALQFMVNVILSKRFHQWARVVVDVQGYRSRREESLNSLGVRVADRVRRNHRPFTLEAMPANDRRIIHLALRDRSDVETYSIGEGAARRVVIAPKK